MSYLKLWVATSVNESDSRGRLNFKKEFLFNTKNSCAIKWKGHRPSWKDFYIGIKSNHCCYSNTVEIHSFTRSHFIFPFWELQTNKIIEPEEILEVIQSNSLILWMRKWRSRKAKGLPQTPEWTEPDQSPGLVLTHSSSICKLVLYQQVPWARIQNPFVPEILGHLGNLTKGLIKSALNKRQLLLLCLFYNKFH